MQTEAALKRTIDRYNLVIIALLCTTTLTPAVIFYVRGPGKLWVLLVFVLLTYLFSRMPYSFFDKIQLAHNLTLYKKLKVHLFKKVATNGDLINRQIRKKFPQHRNVSSRLALQKKVDETYHVEKSHWVLFVFCLLTSIYALAVGSTTTAVILFVGNLVFNLYPSLLQQYNRIRYRRIINKI